MRRSDFFVSQSPSDDEVFPYWKPSDYLEQKFVLINERVREVIKSRVQGSFTRNPALDRKLIEAVEHYGSQPDSLERTQITRSGDVNVFSLLAKRLWRDVARDIATGITPRQCEERYLQLIAAGKWLEQQNTGIKKPPLRHVQPALQPAFVPNKSRPPPHVQAAPLSARIQPPAHATAHGSVPEKKKHKSNHGNHNSHSIHDLVMMDTWYNAVQHDTYSDSDSGSGGSDSDGDVRPTYNTTTNDTNSNTITNVENDNDTRPVRNATSRARNAGFYDTEHIDFTFENDIGFYTTSTTQSTNSVHGNTKRKYTRRDNTYYSMHTATVLPKPKQLRHTTSDIDSYGGEHSSDLGSDESIFDTSSSSEDSSGSDSEVEASGTSSAVPVAITNTDASITDLTTDVADVPTNTASPTASPFKSDATNPAAQCTIIVPNVTPTSPSNPSTVHSHSPTACTPANTATNTDTVDTITTPLMDEVPFEQSDSDNESLYSANSITSIQSVISIASVGSVGSVNSVNWVLPTDVCETSAGPGSSSVAISPSVSHSPVFALPISNSAAATVSRDSLNSAEDVSGGNTDTPSNAEAPATTNTTSTNIVVVDLLDSAEMTEAADMLGDYTLPPTALHSSDNANTIVQNTVSGSAGTTVVDAGSSKFVPITNSNNTSDPTVSTSRSSDTTPPPSPTLTLPPLPPADQTLLRSLLPSRHYHKYTINWRFLALVVNKSTAIVRAYARQWRHERRVVLLDKLVLLRERGVKRKCSVRRAKQSGSLARVKPSTPLPYKVLEKSIVYKGTNIFNLTNARAVIKPKATNTCATIMTKPSSVFSHALLSNFVGSNATGTSSSTGGDVVAEPIRAEFHTEYSCGVDNSTGAGVGVGGTSANVDNQDDSGSESSGGEVHSESEPEAEHHNRNTNTNTNDNVTNVEVGSDGGSVDGDADAMDVVIQLDRATIHRIVPPATTVTTVIVTDTTHDTSANATVNTNVDTTAPVASDTTTSIVTSTSHTSDNTTATIPPETATLLATLLDITTTEVEVAEVLSSANSSTMCSAVGGTVTTIDGATVATNCVSIPPAATTSDSTLDNSIKASSLSVEQTDTTHETHTSDGVVNTSTYSIIVDSGTADVNDKGYVVPPPDEETDGPLVRAAFAYIATHSYLRSLHPDNWRMEGWGTSSSGGSSGSNRGAMEWTVERVKRFRELLSEHEEFMDKIAATVYPIGTVPASANTVATTEYGEVTPQNQLLLNAIQKCLNGQLRIKWQYLCSPTYYDPGLLCPVLRNYQWDVVCEAVGWGRAQCQVLYKNMLSGGGKGSKDTHPVLPPPPTTVAPVAVPVVRPPSPLPKLPVPQWDAIKDKLLLELLQRVTLAYPVDLPALALCSKPAERAAQLTQCVPGWVWEGVASSVGMTAKQCMGRYWSLVKHTLLRSNTSSIHPSTATNTNIQEILLPVVYEYHGRLLNVSTYPWAATRSVDIQSLSNLSDSNTTPLHTAWWEATKLIRQAQNMYNTASSAMKENRLLTFQDKLLLQKCMRSYFSAPLPGRTSSFDTNNKSEDERLIHLVWALGHHTPNNETTPFIFNNPITTVRCILSTGQWLTIATALQREIAWCQERYCELMVCKVSSNYPVHASCKLQHIVTEITNAVGGTNTTPKPATASNTNAITTYHQSIAPKTIRCLVKETLLNIVRSAAIKHEFGTLAPAHRMYCGYPVASFLKQPLRKSGLQYIYAGRLVCVSVYPWHCRRTIDIAWLMTCFGVNYTNHRQRWTDAVLLYVRLLMKQRRAATPNSERIDCMRILYATPMPTDFLNFEPHNRSEDDWLVWLVWRFAHSTQREPSYHTFDLNDPLKATGALISVGCWYKVGKALDRSVEWCQMRYFLLQQAKITGQSVEVNSALLVISGGPNAMLGNGVASTTVGAGGNGSSTNNVMNITSQENTNGRTNTISSTSSTNTTHNVSAANITHSINSAAINTTSPALSMTTTTPPSIPLAIPLPGVLYRYRNQLVPQTLFPWSGSHTASRTLLTEVSKLNQNNNEVRFSHAKIRTVRAQDVYQRVLLVLNNKADLLELTRVELRECLESFFSQPLPPESAQFDPRNRSEDDWLVQWVWALSHDCPPTTTTTHLDPHNTIATVRTILLHTQWETIASALNRSVRYCQERYVVLMQSVLASTDPKPLSCWLVISNKGGVGVVAGVTSGVNSGVSSSVGGGRHNTADRGNNSVNMRYVGKAATTTPPTHAITPQAVQANLPTAQLPSPIPSVPEDADAVTRTVMSDLIHSVVKRICTDVHILSTIAKYNQSSTHSTQPLVQGVGLLYKYSDKFVTYDDYPWACERKHTTAEPFGVELSHHKKGCTSAVGSNVSSSLWLAANLRVMEAQDMYNRLKQSSENADDIKEELSQCQQQFFSQPLPPEYVHFNINNRSEDDWLVYKVWLQYHATATAAASTTPVSNADASTGTMTAAAVVNSILSAQQWQSIALLLRRAPHWCKRRYFEISQAKLHNTTTSPSALLILHAPKVPSAKRVVFSDNRIWSDVNSLMHQMIKTVETRARQTESVPISRTTVPYLTTSSRRANRAVSTSKPTINYYDGVYKMRPNMLLRNGERVEKSVWNSVTITLRSIVSKVEQNAHTEDELTTLNNPTTARPDQQPKLRYGGLLYLHNKLYMTERQFVWAGTHTLHTPLPVELPTDPPEKVARRYYQDVRRVEIAQGVYKKSLNAIKSGVELSGRPQEMLRKCLETFFSLPIPGQYQSFNTLNRSEDDWLVHLVWLATTNRTKRKNEPPFDPANPSRAVCRMLLLWQWQVIADTLCRSVLHCQERYFELLQARIADREPATPPYLLVNGTSRATSVVSDIAETINRTRHGTSSNTTHGAAATGGETSMQSLLAALEMVEPHTAGNSSLNTDALCGTLGGGDNITSSTMLRRLMTTAGEAAATTGSSSTKAIKRKISCIINKNNKTTSSSTSATISNAVTITSSTDIERDTQAQVVTAHFQYCLSPPDKLAQPRSGHGVLLYRHHNKFVVQREYPWSSTHTPSSTLVPEHSEVSSVAWSAAVVKAAEMITRYQQALANGCNGISLGGGDSHPFSAALDCMRAWFSQPMPPTYLHIDPQNKSEDEWLVLLVWLSVRSYVIPSEIPFDIALPVNTVRCLLPVQQWTNLATLLQRSVEWCHDRYCALMRAKIIGIEPPVTSCLLVSQQGRLNAQVEKEKMTEPTTAPTNTD